MPVILAVMLLACSSGPPEPAPLDVSGTESCQWCRMVISDRRFAAQIAANGYDPLFFDDLGCMTSYLQKGMNVPPDGVAYVADFRAERWVPAHEADYFRCAGMATPMSSGLVATQPGGPPVSCEPMEKNSVLGATR